MLRQDGVDELVSNLESPKTRMLTRRGLVAHWSGRYTVAFGNVTDGLVAHSIPEVLRSAGNAIVAPQVGLRCEAYNRSNKRSHVLPKCSAGVPSRLLTSRAQARQLSIDLDISKALAGLRGTSLDS